MEQQIMIALLANTDAELELGSILAEDFGAVADKAPVEQLDWMALLPNADVQAEIKARAVLAYRRELARALAEHLQRMAEE
jgi:hypothetical protein